MDPGAARDFIKAAYESSIADGFCGRMEIAQGNANSSDPRRKAAPLASQARYAG